MPFKYQVSVCNQIGFKFFLFLSLALVTWQALSPVQEGQPAIINDKVAHLLVFFVLSFIADHAYSLSRFTFTKAASLLSYGLFIEIMQLFVPTRHFSWLDLLADAAGILLFFVIYRFLIERIPTEPQTTNNS